MEKVGDIRILGVSLFGGKKKTRERSTGSSNTHMLLIVQYDLTVGKGMQRKNYASTNDHLFWSFRHPDSESGGFLVFQIAA